MKTDTTVDVLHSLSTFRGSITNAETWLFFSFNADDSGEGGSVAISKEFRLGDDLSGLPLILGLLSDWVRFASLPLDLKISPWRRFRSPTQKKENSDFLLTLMDSDYYLSSAPNFSSLAVLWRRKCFRCSLLLCDFVHLTYSRERIILTCKCKNLIEHYYKALATNLIDFLHSNGQLRLSKRIFILMKCPNYIDTSRWILEKMIGEGVITCREYVHVSLVFNDCNERLNASLNFDTYRLKPGCASVDAREPSGLRQTTVITGSHLQQQSQQCSCSWVNLLTEQ